MLAKTNIILTTTTDDVQDTYPNGFAVRASPGKVEIPYEITLSAGTGTLKIQGRSGPSEAWQDLVSVTASAVGKCTRFPFMKATLSGGAGATSRVTLGENVRQIDNSDATLLAAS